MKKVILFLVLLNCLVLIASSTVEITLWHSYRGDEKEALEKVVSNYNNSQNEIKIKTLAIPFDAFPDKITAAIPRGKGPDLFIYAHDRIGGWVKAGIIEPIDYYLPKGLSDKFVEGSFDAMKYAGSVYGLPMVLKSTILYYNKKIISNPPKTTDEMIKMAKDFTNEKEGKYGLVYEIANFYYHSCWLQGFGGRVFDNKNQPVLDSKENIESYKFAQDLFRKHKIVPPEVSNVLVTTLFNENKAAMVISGPWFRAEIKDDIDYGVELLPIISNTNKRATPFFGIEGVIMSSKSNFKKEAFKVMEYLTSKDAAIVMATVGKQPIANKDAYSNPNVMKDKYIPKFREQIKYALPMPSIPQMTMVWSPATTSLSATINGNDPAAELKKAQQEILKRLKEAGFK